MLLFTPRRADGQWLERDSAQLTNALDGHPISKEGRLQPQAPVINPGQLLARRLNAESDLPPENANEKTELEWTARPPALIQRVPLHGGRKDNCKSTPGGVRLPQPTPCQRTYP